MELKNSTKFGWMGFFYIFYTAGIDVNCSNGGTQLERYTCICPGGLTGDYCKSHLTGFCLYNLQIINKIKI